MNIEYSTCLSIAIFLYLGTLLLVDLLSHVVGISTYRSLSELFLVCKLVAGICGIKHCQGQEYIRQSGQGVHIYSCALRTQVGLE